MGVSGGRWKKERPGWRKIENELAAWGGGGGDYLRPESTQLAQLPRIAPVYTYVFYQQLIYKQTSACLNNC